MTTINIVWHIIDGKKTMVRVQIVQRARHLRALWHYLCGNCIAAAILLEKGFQKKGRPAVGDRVQDSG